jgi:hypothetical protein
MLKKIIEYYCFPIDFLISFIVIVSNAESYMLMPYEEARKLTELLNSVKLLRIVSNTALYLYIIKLILS